MLYSRFLVLLIHLGSLNEEHVCKILEPVILTAVVFLVLASSDRLGIFLITDIVNRTIRGKNLKNVWQVVQKEETG